MTLLVPEKKPGLFFALLIFLIEKIMKRHITVARVLIHSPKIAVTSLHLELGVESASKKLTKRLACLIRLKVSLTTLCPFCIDLNSKDIDRCKVTKEEVFALRDSNEASCKTFSEAEIIVMKWIELQSSTPLVFPEELKHKLNSFFSAQELVIMAALGAKVNYWARFMQSLGIQSEGFQEHCPFIGESL